LTNRVVIKSVPGAGFSRTPWNKQKNIPANSPGKDFINTLYKIDVKYR
jgi:hypothetical protein